MSDIKIICQNKRARHEYFIEDSLECGLMLRGPEVKSLRDGRVDVKDCYVTLKKNEAWLIGMKIDPPASLRHEVIDPTRSRKLLLNKKEIKQLSETIEQKSLTCVLTSVYWKENHIKCDLSIGKGKKHRDQRQDIKTRDWERDQGRILKNAKNNSHPTKNFK